MNVAEVKAKLEQGVTSINVARQIFEDVATDTTDTGRLAEYTVYDSRHPEVEKALACLKAATDELDVVLRRLDTCVQAADEYRRTIG